METESQTASTTAHHTGDQIEDIRDQLLGDQDEHLFLSAPQKRRASVAEEDPLPSQPKRPVMSPKHELREFKEKSVEGFSVDRVAINSLVDIMRSVRDAMRENNSVMDKMQKSLAENSVAVSK